MRKSAARPQLPVARTVYLGTNGLLSVGSIAALRFVGCSSQQSAMSGRASPSTAPPSPIAGEVPGGCGSTPVFNGQVPSWVDDAGAHNNPVGLPYVVSTPATAAGFIFGYPLRAGHPQAPSNKILWVVGLPRDGSALVITGHPLKSTTPAIQQTQATDSGPGEIYPSIVDVPQPGCWHLDLSWAGHLAAVELVYL